MKSLFYYLFGIATMLYAFVVLFDLWAPIYLDDYYLDVLATTYSKEWYYSNLTVAAIMFIFIIIWVFILGKGTSHEKKEKLLINDKKEEENE